MYLLQLCSLHKRKSYISVYSNMHDYPFLPRLNKSHKVFDVNEELPDKYVISVCTTFKALESVKANKATGPDNIPAWVLRNYANVLAPPLTAIFNNSLREGVLPMEWKMANVIPLPKTSPPVSIEKRH